jgi:hypothetical protein
MASTRFIREVQIITGALIGREPPDKPVPAPRGTKASLCWCSSLRTALTSTVVRGRTNKSGIVFSIVQPSHSYTFSSVARDVTPSLPTTSLNAAINLESTLECEFAMIEMSL